MSELIRDTLRSTHAADVPFFEPRALRTFADELDEMTPDQRGAIDTDVMVIVSTIVLHERLNVASA
jgi:hypothetical protein